MPLSTTLYVGTDISERVNRTRFYDEGGKEIGGRMESQNDLPGSRDLAGESVAHGLRCYTFNPRQVKKFKESYPDIGKDDWTDAMVIADRLRFGRLPAECYLDERYQPLQRLTRYRRHLVRQLVREKQLALGYVYLKLSAYSLEKPLSDTFGAASQELLEGYLTPDEIVATPIEDLAALLKEHSRGRVADPEEVARVVKQAANRSYQLPKGMVEPVNLILSSSLTTVRALKGQLKQIGRAS